MFPKLLLVCVVSYCYIASAENEDDYEKRLKLFIKSATYKDLPKPTKRSRNNSNEDFEKFFLKASKSVPRIGRSESSTPTGDLAVTGNTEWTKVPYRYAIPNSFEYPNEKSKYPLWSEVAERFEFDPELLSSPDLLVKFEQAMGDDPSVYDWDKFRYKRVGIPIKL